MPEHELAVMIEAAREAGEIALRHFGQAPKFWHKADGQGRVSQADIEVNDFLLERFSREFPQLPILSEECEDDERRLSAKRILIIDPIDGTEAFLDEQKFFAISMALVEDGLPIGAVIYAPALGELYSAWQGAGAERNGKAIRASGVKEVEAAKILASSARYNRPMIEAAPKLQLHFRPSIAYRLALVATGEFDGSFALRPSWDWDIAAGDLLCREAGAALYTKDGDRPRYNQMKPQQNGIVAGHKNLIEKLLKRIR